MPDLEICLDEDPSEGDVARLERGLDEHALPITGSKGFVPVALYLRDSESRIVGGVLAKLNWNWLFIDTLWVAPELRGRGEGARLLREMEDYGRRRGCSAVHLDTFSFQARPFYERLGYEVFGVLEDYPRGHTRYYLRKALVTSG